jgi:2'-5' RNA ligase
MQPIRNSCLRMKSTELYLIALIPPEELRDAIRQLKEEVKGKFNAKHALKSPAHITLQMPFKKAPDQEAYTIEALEQLAALQSPFPVGLSGFGCFTPRVIFVKVENHLPIIELHASLNRVLTEELNFKPNEVMPTIHPHVTIATRDLTEIAFSKAWEGFKERTFNASFEANSLFLLKHNGKFWDIYREFLFKG